jgi:hypothetical protein
MFAPIVPGYLWSSIALHSRPWFGVTGFGMDTALRHQVLNSLAEGPCAIDLHRRRLRNNVDPVRHAALR